ncbi:patatin-like phospholipase family protein [Litorivicinus sp.]|nr:patatin-like phospholipase family protein [Litorivicinus sp.]
MPIFRLFYFAIIVLAVSGIASHVYARDSVGLVLSGGGARGFAHVAVLEALEANRVPIDYIAGTSMGAVIGALYASGLSASQVREKLLAVDWNAALRDVTDRNERSFRSKSFEGRNFLGLDLGVALDQLKLPLAVLRGQKLALVLNELTLEAAKVSDFDALPIPFRAIATDLATGDPVVLDRGSLATVLRASMAVPVLYSPVEIDGRLYVDGGVANNLPIDVARDMGADRVIVVDTSSQRYTTSELTSVVTVIDQLTNLLTLRNTEAQLKTLTDSDVLIEIFPEGIATADFNKVKDALAAGRKELVTAEDMFVSLSVDKSAYRDWQESHRTEQLPSTLAFVEVISDAPRTSSKTIANRLTVRPGQLLDNERLGSDLGKIYALETIDQVEVSVIERGNQVGLSLETREKAWGPDYLDMGFNLEDSLDGRASYNLSGVIRATNINPLGGEWRTELTLGDKTEVTSELFQPIDYGSNWFASAIAGFVSEDRALYQMGVVTSMYSTETREYGLDAGYTLDTRGEFRAGFRQSRVANKLILGASSLGAEIDDSRYFVRAGYDTLDSLGFPTKGVRLLGEYSIHDSTLGATKQYDDLTLDMLYPFYHSNRTTLVAQGYFGYLFETSVTDVTPRYSLGGFTRLSGYSPDEISGRHASLISVIGYQRLNEQVVFPIDQPLVLGFSLEAGNVFQSRDEIRWSNTLTGGSIFVGADTAIGPSYLSFGHTEGGHKSVTLSVGRPFAERN